MNLNTLKEVTRAHLPSLEERIGREMESGTASLIYRDENITHQLLPPHTHTHTHTHLSTLGTQVMLGTLEVNGEATLASVSDREMPA